MEVALGALTKKEVADFIVAAVSQYSSIKKLRKIWDKKNLLKDGFEFMWLNVKHG